MNHRYRSLCLLCFSLFALGKGFLGKVYAQDTLKDVAFALPALPSLPSSTDETESEDVDVPLLLRNLYRLEGSSKLYEGVVTFYQTYSHLLEKAQKVFAQSRESQQSHPKNSKEAYTSLKALLDFQERDGKVHFTGLIPLYGWKTSKLDLLMQKAIQNDNLYIVEFLIALGISVPATENLNVSRIDETDESGSEATEVPLSSMNKGASSPHRQEHYSDQNDNLSPVQWREEVPDQDTQADHRETEIQDSNLSPVRWQNPDAQEDQEMHDPVDNSLSAISWENPKEETPRVQTGSRDREKSLPPIPWTLERP